MTEYSLEFIVERTIQTNTARGLFSVILVKFSACSFILWTIQ